jgi:hypothetical protein
VYSSRLAEVIYFLRPDQQYSQTDLANPTAGASAQSKLAATHTLYRIVRLVLEDEHADFLNRQTTNNQFLGITSALPVHSAAVVLPNCDVSVHWEPNPAVAPARVFFNRASDLPNRRNRYGLFPTNNADDGTTRHVPYSFFTSVDALFTTANRGIHNQGTGASFENWFGRPVLRELSDPGFTGMFNTMSPATPIQPSQITGQTSYIAQHATVLATSLTGADVVLGNVASFDVKVLDDDSDPNITAWPRNLNAGNYSNGANPAGAGTDGSANGPAPLTRAVNPALINTDVDNDYGTAPEFIDLGYRQRDEAFAWTYDPDSLGAAGQINWGQHTPARWRTMGHRRNAGAASEDLLGPRSTYDTWWPTALMDPTVPNAGGTANVANPNWDTQGAVPPYARPLKAIQIKLRVLEPRSKITREITVVHSF